MNSTHAANHEKHRAAFTSVLAAVCLTVMKLIVGIFTGSLGILAEAAHSALDLVAAVVTLLAVRVSGRPADQEHSYGHGKVENLSALFETLLLMVTCVWIVYEAIQRLLFKSVEVDPSMWAFLVMSVSIIVDVNRSRLLYRIARKYDSQALEADALHFSTDVWSSSVVIGGLALVVISRWLEIPWLANADSVAAIGVAGIVVWVSIRLGRRTVMALLDGVPAQLRDDVMRAVRVAGVVEVERVRVRRSGPEAFVDVRLTVARDASFEHTHDIAAAAEEAVQKVIPGADVVVQIEPAKASHEGWVTTVRFLAARHELGAHGIRIYDLGRGGHSVELHLEVSERLSLQEAHAQATAFEEELRSAIPGLAQIITHIEPAGDTIARRESTAADEASVRRIIEDLADATGIDCQPHDVSLRRAGGELQLSFHCTMAPGTPITEAHILTEQIESLLRNQVPNLGRVVIHMEPDND